MSKRLHSALALWLLAATAPAMAGPMVDGDATAGKQKAQACAACHAADGNSTNPQYPKLAGQHASYLLKQLKAFKSGERENAIMKGQVANLSEQDMKDIAVYYANQDTKTGSADEDLVERGKQIYRAGVAKEGIPACIGCHGPAGQGNPAANFPKLAGQHSDYIAAQLKAFKNDQRTNDAGQMMRNIAAEMDEGTIEAVASYIEGLHS